MNKIPQSIIDRYPNLVVEGLNIKVYSSMDEEYNALKKGVVIRDVSGKGVVKLAGEEAFDFIHRLSTNDIKDIKENERRNTIFTNDKGRFIDRVTVFRFRDHALLVGGVDKGALLSAWLDRYIIMEDLSVFDLTEHYSVFEIIGPQSESYLTALLGRAVDMMDNKRVIHLNFERINVIIAKIEVKENMFRYTLVVPADEHDNFLELLLNNNSIFDVKMCGENAYDLFRIENNIPGDTGELIDKFNPHEAGLINEVSFSKGCYIGQEVIARLDTYDKVQKKLVRVKSGVIFNNLPAQLVDSEGNDAGFLTSLAKTSFNGAFPGLAYVRNKFIENGAKLYIDDEAEILIEICEKKV